MPSAPRWRYGPVCVTSACSLCVSSSNLLQLTFAQRRRGDLRLHAHHRDADAEEPANVGDPHHVVDVRVPACGGGYPGNHDFHEVVPPEDRGNRDQVEDADAGTHPTS